MDLNVLDKMSTDMLRAMNKRIVEIIRRRDADRQWNAARELRIGESASFFDKHGQKVVIQIDKINTKTVSGRETVTGSRVPRLWRVAPTLLTPLGALDKPKVQAGVGAGVTW